MLQFGQATQDDARNHFRHCRVGVLPLVAISLWGCLHAPQVTDHDEVAPRSRVRPVDVDPAVAERVGQEALEKVGYEEILNLAEKAGFVEHKADERIQLASYGSIVASASLRVFSRYAFAAAVTSQADSPLPGPADIAAVGILVIGLVDAGLLDGYLLKSAGELILPTGAATLPTTATTNIPDDRSDCQAHLMKCMETSARRGRRGSGSDPGQSICVDCFRQCKNLRSWPDKTFEGKDCKWWDGR